MRRVCILLAVAIALFSAPEIAARQLLLRLPIDFPEFEQGSSFQTTPYPIANADNCSVIGDQPVDDRAVQCGEVDTEPDFVFIVGATYAATVTATPFTRGIHSITWTPTVACVRVTASGEVIAGGSGSFCTQSITSAGQGIFWDLGGIVNIADDAAVGAYSSTVTLSVSGQGLSESLSVSAELEVAEAEVFCTLGTEDSLDFGSAAAGVAGSVAIAPVSGSRTYGGDQSDPTGSSEFSMATATVHTDAGSVVAMVSAPSFLSSSSETVAFLSYMAERASSISPWVRTVTGSGSSTLTTIDGEDAEYRFGGKVTTTQGSAAGYYVGTVTVTFQCN